MQKTLESWFLRQDIIEQLLESGEEDGEASRYADRIHSIAGFEEAEHQTLIDPFDRSVALVLSLVREEELDPWDVDLSAFLKLFTQRVKSSADILDLPACGRLIRLSWEVLNGQAESLLDRIQSYDQEEEMFFDFGWESEYDDDEFLFTHSVLSGDADTVLPNLFDDRIRRDEGRPVTLGELLSALKDACDDAEALQMREENRRRQALEVKEFLKTGGTRMHNEDLEGDISRCWHAMRSVSSISENKQIPLLEVIDALRAQGHNVEDDDSEVASFIAGLFLTHRGFASVTQDEVPFGPIMIEDLWPDLDTFESVAQSILAAQRADAEQIKAEEGGADRYTRLLEERAAKAAEKAAAEKAEAEAEAALETNDETSEVEVENSLLEAAFLHE